MTENANDIRYDFHNDLTISLTICRIYVNGKMEYIASRAMFNHDTWEVYTADEKEYIGDFENMMDFEDNHL